MSDRSVSVRATLPQERTGIAGFLGSLLLLGGGVLLPLRSLVVFGAVSLLSTFAAVVLMRVSTGLRVNRDLPSNDLVAGELLHASVRVESRFAPGLVVHEVIRNSREFAQAAAGTGLVSTEIFSVAKRFRRSVTTVAYSHTPARGRLVFGPTLHERTDPFGFVRRVRAFPNEEVRRVLPRTIQISPSDVLSATRYHIDPTDERARARVNDNFVGDLRPYVAGDEPRRVHWASTARTGALVVRTEDPDHKCFRYGLTIDLSSAQNDHAAFELVIEVAASMALQLPVVWYPTGERSEPEGTTSPPATAWFSDDVDVVILAPDAPHGRRFSTREALLNYLALVDRQALTVEDQDRDRLPSAEQASPARSVRRRALPSGLTVSGVPESQDRNAKRRKVGFGSTLYCEPVRATTKSHNTVTQLSDLPLTIRTLARKS